MRDAKTTIIFRLDFIFLPHRVILILISLVLLLQKTWGQQLPLNVGSSTESGIAVVASFNVASIA